MSSDSLPSSGFRAFRTLSWPSPPDSVTSYPEFVSPGVFVHSPTFVFPGLRAFCYPRRFSGLFVPFSGLSRAEYVPEGCPSLFPGDTSLSGFSCQSADSPVLSVFSLSVFFPGLSLLSGLTALLPGLPAFSTSFFPADIKIHQALMLPSSTEPSIVKPFGGGNPDAPVVRGAS